MHNPYYCRWFNSWHVFLKIPLRVGSHGSKEQRIKHALDDFLGSLQFARSNLAIKISDSEAQRSKSFLISLFLELAWTSSVAISGKMFKTYSQFRDETQPVFYLAHQRLQVGQKEYDPLQLAKDLMSFAVNLGVFMKPCEVLTESWAQKQQVINGAITYNP